MTILEKTNPKLPARPRRARRVYDASKEKARRARAASKDWFKAQIDTARSPYVRRWRRLRARLVVAAVLLLLCFVAGVLAAIALAVLAVLICPGAMLFCIDAIRTEVWILERKKV